MADKSPEVLVCDASIMKNVWEIRLRDYGQKLQLENERIEKSALEKINQDWASRMSGKIKPRRVERKVKPPEESPAQTYKAKMALGRPSGFVSSRHEKTADLKKDTTKRNKLALLLKVSESQPSLMIWSKSWKFSRPLSQSEQVPSAEDWGQSWKFLNLQPNNEGKSWMEHEHGIENNMNNDVLFLWHKLDRVFQSQDFEQDVPMPDWKKSWKYTKERKESPEKGLKNLRLDKLDMLQESHCHNMERSLSEWNECWKSVKSPIEEHVQFMSESVNEEENTKDNVKEFGIPWGESWKHFKKILHMTSKSTSTSVQTGWMESWRISKAISQISQYESISNPSEPQTSMPEEPLDPKVYRTLMKVSRDEKHRMWNGVQFQEGDVPLCVSEWEKSWLTIKNLTEYREQPVETQRDQKQTSERQQAGLGLAVKCVEFEVFTFPKGRKPATMPARSEQKDKQDFISTWKDSWKSFKHQRRQEWVQSQCQRILATIQIAMAQPSLIDWANSWRFTNLIANQNSDLWQQGWPTYTPPRPERRVQQNEVIIEGFPHNGPTLARGWGESWRSTRRQHHVEREGIRTPPPSTRPTDTQVHRRVRSLADWDQSWQFSTNQCHHNRPSMVEWADSWRFCSFHCENWADHQAEQNQYEKSLEIGTRKESRRSRRFGRLLAPRTFKEWNNSWRTKIFDKKEDSGPGLLHLTKKENMQTWDNSWMLSLTQFYQSEKTESSTIHGPALAGIEHYESSSEWGRSWKISNPQPPETIVSWFKAQPNKCSLQSFLFWSRHRNNHGLLSLLSKDVATLRKWAKSWRFMKMESKLDFKSGINNPKHKDDSVIMTKAIKMKKNMYSLIDKDTPQVKRWVDASKLAKTQPRPKRDAKLKHDRGEADGVVFAEWAESWRFANDSTSAEPVKMPVSFSAWEDSWKFLLNAYAPQNGPKQMKGRS